MKITTPAIPAFILAALLIVAIAVLAVLHDPIPPELTALAYVLVGVGGGVSVPGLVNAAVSTTTSTTTAPQAPVPAAVSAPVAPTAPTAPVSAAASLLTPEQLAQITAAMTAPAVAPVAAPAPGSGVGVVTP